VNIDWARVALKKLASQLTSMNDDATVTFSFDGNVLTIRSAAGINVMPAVGMRWANRYGTKAGALKKNLPKRLMGREIEVSVWESHLRIGNRRFSGIVESRNE
jgi:hypothetical protein